MKHISLRYLIIIAFVVFFQFFFIFVKQLEKENGNFALLSSKKKFVKEKDHQHSNLNVISTTTTNFRTSTTKPVGHLKEFVRDNGNITEEEFYSKLPYVINPYPYSVMVNPRKKCPNNVHSVIIVHSIFEKYAARMAIRSTWGSLVDKSVSWPDIGPLNHSIALFFVFGVHKDPGKNDGIYEENEKYGDIVQGNFIDSYKNMTLKSLLDLKFIIEFCSDAKYLIKCDDDMFLNLPALLNAVNEMPSHSIMGPFCVGSLVRRGGKWALSTKEFPFKKFPPYEAGASYVITRDLWEDIFDTAHYVPYIFIDDVYITGIIGKILNVTHIKVDKFAFWTTILSDMCDLKTNKMFTATNLTPEKIKHIWVSLATLRCVNNSKATTSILKVPFNQIR